MSKGDKYLYSNGTVRGPVMESVDWNSDYDFNEYFASLPSIKVEGVHNWKEGQELIEEKDFNFNKVRLVRGTSYKYRDDDQVRRALNDDFGYYYPVAIPLQSAQEPKGEKDESYHDKLARIANNAISGFVSPSKPAEPKKGEWTEELALALKSFNAGWKSAQTREAEMQKEIDSAIALIKKIFDHGLISDNERGKEIWHEYILLRSKTQSNDL